MKKNVFDFCCLLSLYFPLLGFCFLICRIPDLRFASHLALCVRLFGRGRKKAPEVQKKMSRGSKKDPGFATRCFGAEEKTAQNNAYRLKKRLCSFSGPHCGAEKKLEVEKKTCRGRKQEGPIARSRKRHFGVEKKSSPSLSPTSTSKGKI